MDHIKPSSSDEAPRQHLPATHDADPWAVPSSGEESSQTTQNHRPFRIAFAALDGQFGVLPRLSMPPKLHEAMFASDSRFDANDVLVAVIDAALIPDLPEYLINSGLDCRCLFRGKAAEKFGHLAPWMVVLPAESSILRRLMTARGAKTDYGWWQSRAAILIRAAAPADAVERYLRRLTRMPDEQGKWRFVRFYASDVAEILAEPAFKHSGHSGITAASQGIGGPFAALMSADFAMRLAILREDGAQIHDADARRSARPPILLTDAEISRLDDSIRRRDRELDWKAISVFAPNFAPSEEDEALHTRLVAAGFSKASQRRSMLLALTRLGKRAPHCAPQKWRDIACNTDSMPSRRLHLLQRAADEINATAQP